MYTHVKRTSWTYRSDKPSRSFWRYLAKLALVAPLLTAAIASADTANRSNGGVAAHQKNYGAVFGPGRLSLFREVRQGVLPAELLFLTLTAQGLQPQLARQSLFVAKHHSPKRT